MSEFLQSDQHLGTHHLDADQISALVDHVLPLHEREAVLAHLAVCGECRETVALVSPPLEAVPIEIVKEKRPRWFFSLGVLAPAAAGLAAVLLYVHFAARPHRRSAGPEPQIAQEAPAPRIQAPVAPITKTNEPAAHTNTSSLSGTEARLEKKQTAAATAPALDAMSASSAEQATAGSRFLAGNQPAAHAEMPQAKSAPAQQALQESSGDRNRVGAGLASGGLNSAPAETPRQFATQAQVAQESTKQTDVLSAKDIDTLALEGRDTTELLKVLPGAVTSSVHLPGGAAPLSSVTRGKQVLAIDARHHHLYLSNDGGATWASVRVPWKSPALKAETVSYSDELRKKQSPETRGEILDGAPLADSQPAAPAPPPPVAAQNSTAAPLGSVAGKVSDLSGGVIPMATVSVTNSATHVTRVAATDAGGQYRFDGLTPGDYEITAKVRGFESAKNNIHLVPGKANVADFALTVGAETLTVTVSATEEMIPTTSPISNESIRGEAAKPAAGLQTPSQATALFQITTRNGEQWTSADGLTWHRK